MIRWDGLLRRATGRSGTVNGKRGQKAAQLTLLTWLNNHPAMSFLWHSAQRRLNCQLLSGDLVRKVLSHLSALRSLARATLPQMAEFLRQSSALLESRQETTVGEGKPLIRARLMLKVFKAIFFKQFSRFFETLGKADAQNLQRTNNFFDKTFWNSESSRVALGRRDLQQIQRQGTASDFSILAPPLYVKQACEERLEGKYLTLL